MKPLEPWNPKPQPDPEPAMEPLSKTDYWKRLGLDEDRPLPHPWAA